MNKKALSNKELFCLNVLFLINFFITENYLFSRSPYSYIFIGTSFIFACLFIYIYNKLLILNPNKNMFEIMDKYLNKFISSILKIIYIIFFIYTATLDARLFILFLNQMVLENTNIFIIALMFVFLTMILSRRDLNSIGRISSMLFFCITVIIFISIIFTYNQLDFSNILIPFENNNAMQNILLSICYPFGKIFSILFFGNNLTKQKDLNKITYSSLIVAFILSLLIILRNIFMLGIPTMVRVTYPSYIAVGLIKVGEFLSRFEIIIAFNYMVCSFISVSLYTHICSVGIKTIFKKLDYKKLCTFLSLIILIGSLSLKIDNTNIYLLLIHNIYLIIALVVIIPFLMFLIGMAKKNGEG